MTATCAAPAAAHAAAVAAVQAATTASAAASAPPPTLPPTPPSSLLRPPRSPSARAMSPSTMGMGHHVQPPAPPAVRLETLPPRILTRIARAVGEYNHPVSQPQHPAAHGHDAVAHHAGGTHHHLHHTAAHLSPVAHHTQHQHQHKAQANGAGHSSASGHSPHAQSNHKPNHAQSKSESSIGDPPPHHTHTPTHSVAAAAAAAASHAAYYDDYDLDDYHQPSLLALAWTCHSLMDVCLPLLWSSLRTDMELPVPIDTNNLVRLKCTRNGRLFYSDTLCLGPAPTPPPPVPAATTPKSKSTVDAGEDLKQGDTGMLSPPASPKLPPAAIPLDVATSSSSSTPPPVTVPPPTRWLFTSDRILACSSGQLYLVDPNLSSSTRRPAIRTIPMHHVRRFRLSLGAPSHFATRYYTAYYAHAAAAASLSGTASHAATSSPPLRPPAASGAWLRVSLDDMHSLISGSLARLPALRHLHLATPTPLDPERLAKAIAHMPARAQLASLHLHFPLTSPDARLDLSGTEFPSLRTLSIHFPPTHGSIDALPDHMPKCSSLTLIASSCSERLAHQLVHLRRLQILTLQIHGDAQSREWLAQHTAPHLPATLHTLTVVTDQLDKLMDNVCALPHLQHLAMHCVPPNAATAESSESVNYLAGADPVFNGTHFPELTRVEVHSGKLTHALVSSLAQIPQLQVLVMHGAIVPALASCTAACKWTLPRVYTLEAPPGVLEQVLARIRLPAWYGLVVHPKVPVPAGEKTATAKAHGQGGKNNNADKGNTADKSADAGTLAVTIDTHLPLSFKFARLRALHVARCKDLALTRTHMSQLTELSVHPRQLMQLGAAPHAKFGANLTTLLIEPDLVMGVLHLNTQLAFPNLKSLHIGASAPYLPTNWTAASAGGAAVAAAAVPAPASAVPMRIEPAARALEWLTSLPLLCALYIRHPLRLVFPTAASHTPLHLVFANRHSGHVWRELARGLDFAPASPGRPHAGAVADRPPPIVHVRVGFAVGDDEHEVERVVADMEPLLVALGRDEARAGDVAWRACEVARRRGGGVVEEVSGAGAICVVTGGEHEGKSGHAAAGAKGRVDSAVGSSASSSRETSPVRAPAQGGGAAGAMAGGRRRRIGSESARLGIGAGSAAKLGFARSRRATVGAAGSA